MVQFRQGGIKQTLAAVLAGAPVATDRGRPRLWVDRAFAARGAGTIVTGTLGGGSFAVDDDIVIEPGGRHARVRAIESHHERLTHVDPGARVAVNLAGIEHSEVGRGDAVVRPRQWERVKVFDGALTMVPGVAPLRRGVLQVHVGSGVHPAHVRPLDDGFVRVRFTGIGLPLAPGDRLVLRSSARRTTVAGVTVLDLTPTRRAADAPARLALPLAERIIARRGHGQRADEIIALAGTDHAGAVALLTELVERGARRSPEDGPSRPERSRHCATSQPRSPKRITTPTRSSTESTSRASRRPSGSTRPTCRAALAEDGGLVVERGTVRLRTHGSEIGDDPTARRFLDALDAAPFTPPSPAEIDVAPEVVRALAHEGAIVSLDGFYFSAAALDEARRRVALAVNERGSLKLSDLRDLLVSTRKFVVPIASMLDSDGITRRRGDDRIAGPRAADYASGPKTSPDSGR